jgi:hypothetical protein
MRILCLHGGSRYRLMNAFLDAIGDGFRACGHEVVIGDVWRALDEDEPEGLDLVVSFGAVGGDLEWHTPILSWLVDNPVWSPELFAMNPARDGVLVVNGAHVSVVNEFLGLDLPAGFVPHGIDLDPALGHPAFDDRDRDIDVLVAGSFEPRQNVPWTTEHPGVAAAMDMTHALANERWDHHMRELEVTALFREAADAHGVPAVCEGHRLVAPILACLDARLRDRRRLACVQSLDGAGVVMHLAGTGWERAGLANGVELGPLDHHELLRVARRAKVIANVGPPLFNEGWHERIPLGMASGALVVTEHNDFVAADENVMPLLDTYEMAEHDGLGDVVRRALADPARADRTRDAFKILRDHHTWAHRAESILQIVSL